MAIQTFTAAQVLTAAQMNALQANDYNQTVSTKTASYTLVAADKGTRVVMNSASATTITVNTSLFSAGDTLFLQNISTGVCTVTAGTATVASAGSLAIPQNGSGTLYFTSAGVSIYYPSAGASGLNLITSGSVTSGTTVSLNSIFSATYDNYYVIFSNIVQAGSTNVVQFRTGGVTNTTSNYSFARSYLDVSAMAFEAGSSGTTSIGLGSTTANVMNTWEMVISRPFATGETSGWFRQAAENTSIVSWFGFHLFKATTSFDGLIYTAGSTFTSASYAIYGLAN